jgi:uncharacterized membrane protein
MDGVIGTSDRAINDELNKLVSEQFTDDERRQIIAATVLFAYAKGSLTIGNASDVVEPLVQKVVYRAQVDETWRRRQFKRLGELRKASFSLSLRCSTVLLIEITVLQETKSQPTPIQPQDDNYVLQVALSRVPVVQDAPSRVRKHTAGPDDNSHALRLLPPRASQYSRFMSA